MSQDNKALFFSVSGQRGTGRTDLYEKLRLVTRREFPNHTFAFLGNPLANLPCPLLWNKRQKKMPPTTRLFLCWAKLDQFAMTQLTAALQAADVVITDGFGLNAVLYATACSSCETQNGHVFDIHHGCVKGRLKVQDISPPTYFITHADVATVDAWMLKKWPKLKDVPEFRRHAFIEYEERVICRYFDDKTQLEPYPLDASLTIDEMCGKAIEVIGQRLKKHVRVAA